MKDFFSVEGPFASAANLIADWIMISVLMVLCCIPVVTFGASATAAYETSVLVIREKKGHVFGIFFESFRKALKKTWLFSLIYVLLTAIAVFDGYFFFINREIFKTSLYFYFLLFAVLFLACNIGFLFPCLSHYSISKWKIWKFSVILQFKYFFVAFLFLLLLVLGGIAIRFQPWSLVIVPGVFIYIYTFPMEWLLQKYRQNTTD